MFRLSFCIGCSIILFSLLISEGKYGYTRMPVIMVAKDGKVIEDDQRNLSVERSGTIQHPETGKFMDNHSTFFLTNAEKNIEYRVEYVRPEDILVASLLDMLPDW